jgi:hypothetical protein
MLDNTWKSVERVLVLAILMDAIWQFIVWLWFYPGEAMVVAVTLAIVPYLLIRGPANRIAQYSRTTGKARMIGDETVTHDASRG